MLEQRGNQVCRTHEPLFAGQDGRDFPMWSECQITKNAHEDISQNLRGLIDLTLTAEASHFRPSLTTFPD